MDTKTLVVGQKVSMSSGVYGLDGKVVKVTSDGVEVQVVSPPAGAIYRFAANGKGCDGRQTNECGPWELDDISSK